MNALVAWLKSWVKSKNITTHTVGAAIVTFAFVYDSSPTVRNYIGTTLTGFPVVVTNLGVLCTNIVAGVTLWRNYSHPSSPAGTMVQAEIIANSPNPPTKAEVNAATPPAAPPA